MAIRVSQKQARKILEKTKQLEPPPVEVPKNTPVVKGRYVIDIPDWTPTSLNKLLGRNRFVIGKIKKKDYFTVYTALLTNAIPHAKTKRRVSITITFKKLVGDTDNYNKSLRDALVKHRILVDDSTKWAEFAETVVLKGDKNWTTIVIEDTTDDVIISRLQKLHDELKSIASGLGTLYTRNKASRCVGIADDIRSLIVDLTSPADDTDLPPEY